MPFDWDANPLSLSGLFPATTAPVQIDVYGYCQMACFYCFSNRNKDAAGRKLNLKNSLPALLRQLDRAMSDPLDPLGFFLRGGYYAGLSNTTDPFQREEKTHRATETILEWARANGVSLFIETKGNVLLEEWDRYAPLIVPGKTCVYISLSMLDDAIRRKCEPGALDVAGRLELMRRLADLGCGVIAAANPYVPAWLPDLDEYCAAVRDVGATDVFPFFLHFTADQREQIPDFYDAEVAKANVLPQFQAQGFAAWKEATARAGIGLALAQGWDSRLGYLDGHLSLSRAVAPRGKQFYPLHDFLRRLSQISRERGGVPVLFSWLAIEAHLRQQGVRDMPLRSRVFDGAWMHSAAGHKEFRASIPKVVSFYDLLRWAYNSPWAVRGRGVWGDPRTRALFSRTDNVYEGDREKNKVGVWFPVLPQHGTGLAIDSGEFDIKAAHRVYGLRGGDPCWN